MNICYLGLGSNQKSPERHIRQAIKELGILPSTSVLKCSNLYWSKAWGITTQQNFCNAVVKMSTSLTPELLLKWCHIIERKHHRVRKKKWGPRTLDIDIILYGNRVIRSSNLTIPHPHYRSRDFVLHPLLELNPAIAL
jgi:2-amino-4-hydroxy-6-hydroxymethyldihydropteridine diphosphokinase